MSKYYNKILNEGFDVIGKRLVYTNRHDIMLDMNFSGNPVKFSIYSNVLKKDITVYSIFKRMQLSEPQKKFLGIEDRHIGDANPVILALKKEKNWKFNSNSDEDSFWRSFEYLLRRWMREHKNEFETALVVPTSSDLNAKIVEKMKKLAAEVGITSFIEKGLVKLPAKDVLEMSADHDSFFYNYWSEKNIYRQKYRELSEYIDNMIIMRKGQFRYHDIPDTELRKTVLDTIYWDPEFKDYYINELNDKNLLIVDDSITLGQTIDNTLKAISSMYHPNSICVLTMFSKLYNSDGTEIDYVET